MADLLLLLQIKSVGASSLNTPSLLPEVEHTPQQTNTPSSKTALALDFRSGNTKSVLLLCGDSKTSIATKERDNSE